MRQALEELVRTLKVKKDVQYPCGGYPGCCGG